MLNIVCFKMTKKLILNSKKNRKVKVWKLTSKSAIIDAASAS